MKWRIWLLSLGITFACLIVFSFAATQVYYKSSIDDSKEYLRVYMNAFGDEFTLNEKGAEDFSKKLNGARVTFMDAQGNVLADSMAGDPQENHSDRSEIKDAIFNEEGFAVRGSSTPRAKIWCTIARTSTESFWCESQYLPIPTGIFLQNPCLCFYTSR